MQLINIIDQICEEILLNSDNAHSIQSPLIQTFCNQQMSQDLVRTSTIKVEHSDSWAQLVSLSSGLPNYQLKQNIIIVGRNPTCTIQINDRRLSSKHCQLQKGDSDRITILDLSTNGTFIKDQVIGKNKEVQLLDGQQIWLLPPSKVKPTEAIGFKFQLAKKQEDNPPPKKQQEKQVKQQKTKTSTLAQNIKDTITCAFCFQIMHNPVSIQPCNHRFCGACLTELVKCKKGQCINCRKEIQTAIKDSSFNSIIDDYLNNNPDEKRDPKEIEDMDKKNIFSFDPTDVYAMINGKKAPIKKKVQTAPSRGRGRRTIARVNSDLSASDSDDDGGDRCRQCIAQRNGFKCSARQNHVGCITCGKLIAQRDDKSLHQNCLLCTNYYCNLYYPPCAKTGHKLKLLNSRRGQCKIDAQLLRSNTVEFDAIRNYLISKKMTSKQVFDAILKDIDKEDFKYIIDRKIMKIAPSVSRQIKLQRESAVCDACWRDLWFQMVFHYQNKINENLPSSIRDRPICYWGINCKTMDHKKDHAKRYNHMVYQTRF